MNQDTKKKILKTGEVRPEIIQIQVEDYYLTNYKVIIVNNEIVYSDDEEEDF